MDGFLYGQSCDDPSNIEFISDNVTRQTYYASQEICEKNLIIVLCNRCLKCIKLIMYKLRKIEGESSSLCKSK